MAQLYDSNWSQLVTPQTEGRADIIFHVQVQMSVGPSETSYFPITYLAVDQSGYAASLLQPSPDEIRYLPGQVIHDSAQPYLGSPNPPGHLARLVRYNWLVEFPGARITVSPSLDRFPDQTSVLIGFSRDYQGQTHYGWIRLEREITRTEDFFDDRGRARNYSFLPVAVAEHPVPNLPIRAGFPPELPPIESEVVAAEPGYSSIRLRWPEGLQGVRLEQADQLAEPMNWVPVSDVSGNEALLPLPDDGQLYFRLHHAP